MAARIVSEPPSGADKKLDSGAHVNKTQGKMRVTTAKTHNGDWYEQIFSSSMMKIIPNARYAAAAAAIGISTQQHRQNIIARP